MGAGHKGLNEGYAPHLADVMDTLYEVYAEIPDEKIRNCWVKSTLVSDAPAATAALEAVPTEAALSAPADDAPAETEAAPVPAPPPAVPEAVAAAAHVDDEAELLKMTSDFLKKVTLKPPRLGKGASSGGDDFEEALWEMSLAVKENGGVTNLKEVFDGWVDMESNEFCVEAMADEVEELLDVMVLCKLKDVVDEDEPVDDAEDTAEDRPQVLATQELIDELATKLKSLCVQIGDLGDDYTSVARDADDVAEGLRSTFRKVGNAKTAKKQKEARQPGIHSFLKKP